MARSVHIALREGRGDARGQTGLRVRALDVLCPGFAVDCLETLEEISMQNRDLFLGQGGEAFDYVPCLNSSPAHVDVMEDVVLQHVGGWPELGAMRLDDDDRTPPEPQPWTISSPARS